MCIFLILLFFILTSIGGTGSMDYNRENGIPFKQLKSSHFPPNSCDGHFINKIKKFTNLVVEIDSLSNFASDDSTNLKFQKLTSTKQLTHEDHPSLKFFDNFKDRCHENDSQPVTCDIKSGSGILYRPVDKPPNIKQCLCLLCKQNHEKISSHACYFYVVTLNEVICDLSQAVKSILRCTFYSDETENEEENSIYGVDYIPVTDPGYTKENLCIILCVSHDETLTRKILKSISFQPFFAYEDKEIRISEVVTLVSHPKGKGKMITNGSVIDLSVPLGGDFPLNKPIKCDRFGYLKCILQHKLLSSINYYLYILYKEMIHYHMDKLACEEIIEPLRFYECRDIQVLNNQFIKVKMSAWKHDDASNSVPTIHLHFFDKRSNSEFIPGEEELITIRLVNDMTFTLPIDADFVIRASHHNTNIERGCSFPNGTRFHLINGTEITFPTQIVFLGFRSLIHKLHVQYDIKQPPNGGTKGGLVILSWYSGSIIFMLHTNHKFSTNKNDRVMTNSSRLLTYKVLEMSIMKYYDETVDWLLPSLLGCESTDVDLLDTQFLRDIKSKLLDSYDNLQYRKLWKAENCFPNNPGDVVSEKSRGKYEGGQFDGRSLCDGSLNHESGFQQMEYTPDEDCFYGDDDYVGDAFYHDDAGNGMESGDKNCTNRYLHHKFTPIKELNISHIPREYQTEQFLDRVKNFADLTVAIKVVGISKHRPDFYSVPLRGQFPLKEFKGHLYASSTGSGFIVSQYNKSRHSGDTACSCKFCNLCSKKGQSPPTNNWYFVVATSNHVVYDVNETKKTVFQCFFDDDGHKNKFLLYGVDYSPKRAPGFDKEEVCFVLCVTHDGILADKLHNLLKDRYYKTKNKLAMFDYVPYYEDIVILISHPHGLSKRVSVGECNQYTVPLGEDFPKNQPIQFDDITKCIVPYKEMSEICWEDVIEAEGIDLNSFLTDNKHTVSAESYKLYLPKNALEVKQYLEKEGDPLDMIHFSKRVSWKWEVKLFVNVTDVHPKIHLEFNKVWLDRSDLYVRPEINGGNSSPDPYELFEFYLPRKTTFILQTEARFAKRYDNNGEFWLPRNTVCYLSSNMPFLLTPDMRFKRWHSHIESGCYLTYTTQSCPGSSGGTLLVNNSRGDCYVFPHSGRLDGNKFAPYYKTSQEWLVKQLLYGYEF